MKKLLAIGLCWLALILSCSSAERDFKMVGRDFNLFGDAALNPLSVGITSWTDKDLGHAPALYTSAAFFSYMDVIRLEGGTAVTWDLNRGYPNLSLITGISFLITDRIVLGGWYAPFWGLVKNYPDDPWGVMIGYTFSL